MKTISTVASIAILSMGLTSAAATAQENDKRWYASADFGLGSLSSATLTYSDGTNVETANAKFDDSFASGATVGYRFGNSLAVEGELMYRTNDLEAVNLPSLGNFTDGDFASLGFAVSALYNFDIGTSGKLSGYIGPGFLYFQEIDIDFEQSGQQEISFETDDTAFQLKLGGRYEIGDRWFVDAGATWLMADSVRLELPTDTAQSISSDYDHWTFRIGAGLRF